MGKIRKQSLKKFEQYETVNDEKLRLTLMGMADKYDERVRKIIYATYSDMKIATIYNDIRKSGIYDKGSKDKSKRKILEIPNAYVYDFLTALFGKDWILDDKAIKHELVKPWWVVSRL